MEITEIKIVPVAKDDLKAYVTIILDDCLVKVHKKLKSWTSDYTFKPNSLTIYRPIPATPSFQKSLLIT
jgi:hypothetical protein